MRVPTRCCPRTALGLAFLLLAVGGCHTSGRLAPQDARAIYYYPDDLSPDGRLLFLPERDRAIDTSTGAEVWHSQPGHSVSVLAMSWAPPSGSLCWSDLDPEKQTVRLCYSQVPAGSPIDVHFDLVPQSTGIYNVCFGRSADEIVIGALPAGLSSRTVYYVVKFSKDGRSRVASAVQLPAQCTSHFPIQMLRVGNGERVLIVGRELASAAVYMLDIDRGTISREFGGEAKPLAIMSSEDRKRLPGIRLLTAEPGRHWLFGLNRGTSGCELFRLTEAQPMYLAHVGFVKLAVAWPAPLPNHGGCVIAMLSGGGNTKSPSHMPPATSLYLLDNHLSPVRKLTGGGVRDDLPLWSEAAHRVIFRRNAAEIWSVSLNGGDVRKVWPSPSPAR